MTVVDPILTLAEPETLRNPYPWYARLRAETPVLWHAPLESWLVTRFEDCVTVLRDSARFAADPRRIGVEMPPQAISVQTLDPPEHTAIRRVLIEALRTGEGAGTERIVREETGKLLDGLAGRASFDLVADFAEPLALTTITRYLGVPRPDVSWFRALATAIVDGMDSGVWPERHEPAMAARAELAALADGWLSDPPEAGIVALMAEAGADGQVPRQVVANSLRVLLHAGYASAGKLLGLAIAALLDSASGLAGFLRAEPAPAVEELLRFTSPVQAMGRVCVEQTTLGDEVVRPGESVTLLLGAANRDPARFPDPDVLLLDRRPNPHLGFGRGAHSCLGAPFAVVQARIALSVLAERLPALRAASAPTYRRTLTLRGLDSFEVTPG
ncbi:cytochrome P450 [Rugosimonospora africana]|uniref:Cytochrome P450 n=1 Tax=Rugosimonospora africana TaxID=556532 RepID=A0A8J3QS93_9ACTN|nr:cytochrome P450 [Rugosimonospora africana]GIH16560.1 cytochrome P450 [Rugosimonospora africana]